MSDVVEIVKVTEDAYSRDRYGKREWVLAAYELAKRGFTVEEAATVLNSKWSRWAADNAYDSEHPTAAELMKFIDEPKNHFNLYRLMTKT